MVILSFCSCLKDSYPPVGTGNELVITTEQAADITQTGAMVTVSIQNGTGANNYDYSLSTVGVLWDTVSQLSSLSNPVYGTSGSSAFSATLSGLTPGRTYYVCGFAQLGQGYVYGNTVSFMSLPVVPPTVSGLDVYAISTTYADCEADVSSNGGGNLTAEGVCWSTAANPTIANSRTMNGNVTGGFYAVISGLAPLTTYYVRAYATNVAGTAYSPQISFKTQ